MFYYMNLKYYLLNYSKKMIYLSIVNIYFNLMNNQTTKAYATQYFDTFCNLFEITSDGNLNTTQNNLLKIEEWFNQSYIMISLITGVPLTPLNFKIDLGLEHEENKRNLMHIYSVSYTCLHHFSRILKKDIPIQFCPMITSIEYL